MQIDIERLKEYLTEQSALCSGEDGELVCDLLYRFYMDTRVEDPEIIREQYKMIHSMVSHMPLQQQDEIWDAVCMICTEYGRSAFRNGLHMGARLILELSV